MSNPYAPYRLDAADLIRGSHEQRATLTVTGPGGTWTPAILAGSLTLSEDWSPYAQVSLSVANEFSAADLAGMDPRGSLTAELTAGYVHPDGALDLHPIFTGQVQERTEKDPSKVLELTAASADMFAHDARWLGAATWKTFAGVTEAVNYFAGYATGKTVDAVSSLGVKFRPELVASIPLEPGQLIWDVLADLALAAGVRVYVDTAGTWTVAAKPSTAGETAAYLSTGGGGLVYESEDRLGRSGYYAAAVLRFKWRDAGGVDHDVTGTYGTAGAKTYTDTRAYPANQSQADAAALDTVRNLSTRGNGYECKAVAAYWIRPGMTVQVTLATGAEARHIVRAVTFDLAAGTMSVITREPTNLGV